MIKIASRAVASATAIKVNLSKTVLIGTALLLTATLGARAQAPTTGEPWFYAQISSYGYHMVLGSCSNIFAGGVGACCAPTTSAATCANEAAAVACSQFTPNNIWCGATATTCNLQGPVIAQCTMTNGAFVSPTSIGGSFFVTADSQQLPDCGCNKNRIADPISPSNGNVYHEETDIPAQGSSPLSAFERFYNSEDPGTTDLSVGWRHSFSRQIIPIVLSTPYQQNFPSNPRDSAIFQDPASACSSGWTQVRALSSQWPTTTASYANGVCSLSLNGAVVATTTVYNAVQLPPTISGTIIGYTAVRDDGQLVNFTLSGSAIVPATGSTLRLAQSGSGYLLIDDDDNQELYNSTGNLASVTTRAGVVETMGYDSSGRLSTATDSFGRTLALGYNAQNQLTSVTDPSSNAVKYGFDSSNRLSTVTNLDLTSRTYVYENTTFPTLLTGVIDENASRYSTWGYNASGQGNSSTEALGANAMSLIYNSDGSVQTTDALGAVRTFKFNIIGNQNRVISISGSQCPTCDEPASTTYDSAGFVSSRTDYNGNLTCYANDPVRGLELVRIEGFAPSSACPANLSTYVPVSGTLQRKITTQWSASWREPSLITEPNRTTGFTFYANGTINTKTITDTSVTPNVARTWTYTYNGYGEVLTIDGPRTDVADVTAIQYYTCATGNQCGQINTITDALGHVTTFSTYNAYGQPLTGTDPNGVPSTLTYDARQRLLSSELGTETTSYTFYPTGLLKLVTLPDSSTILYAYDAAHRLTDITDTLGNHIHYTLDALGNRTADNTYDPTNTLRRTHTRVFNALNLLYQDIKAAGTAAVTTTLGYDSQGNLKTVAAPLSRNTVNVYDALNHLSQIANPNTGVTKIGYDANDNLTSVIDPRTFTTSYTHNGFNQVSQIVSPDTGTTNKTYDSGGNLATSTDARSAQGAYSYDALNRLTKIPRYRVSLDTHLGQSNGRRCVRCEASNLGFRKRKVVGLRRRRWTL